MRYPRWGPGGAHARTTHTSLPPQPSSPANTPQPSYRTPMRYPRWGPGGAHARTTQTSLPPNLPSPAKTPNRLTAPRCGTHGGEKAHTPPITIPLNVATHPHPVPPNRRAGVGRYPGVRAGTHSPRYPAQPPGDPPPSVVPHSDAVPTVVPGWRTRPHHSHVTTTKTPSPFGDLCITNSPHSDPSRHVTLSEAEGSGSEGWGVVVRRAGDSSLRSE